MALTLGKLLRECDKIVKNAWIDKMDPECVKFLLEIKSIIDITLVTEWKSSDIRREWNVFYISHGTEIQKETLAKILLVLEEYNLNNEVLINFWDLLETNEENIIFSALLDISNYWIRKTIEEIHKQQFLKKVKKDTPLYRLIKGLCKWEDLTYLMHMENKRWRENTPKDLLVEKNFKIWLFLDKLRNLLFRNIVSYTDNEIIKN